MNLNEIVKILESWKDEGKKIVGVVQHGIFPDELVFAAGAIPLRLILGGREEQELGDQYLSATTCPYSRATIGFLEAGHPLYRLLDVLIVGTFCNGVQNIGNYADNFNIPTYSFLVPHYREASALNFYKTELHKLKTFLENFTGNPITHTSLNNAIELYNQLRTLLRQLNAYRQQPTPPIRGMQINELVAQAFLTGPEVMIPHCQDLLLQLQNSPPQYSGARIFLTGSGITMGDSLFEVIEEHCGGIVVADDLWSSMDYFLEDVNMEGSDLLSNLADRYLKRNLCGRMAHDHEVRIPKILELYRTFHASGIIYHTLKFCDSYSNLKPEFKQVMIQHHIPVLELDRDYAESSIGQIQTRIEAFLEMIT
ncbi:MAG: 2-hydroxyacyl-CoA dehydratase subunit D [Candidatus Helarchaeota archaeon]